ncbi:MAG: hypothetical protein LBI48_03415 [Burkholderiaceae bacterium]|nr:hypothetical protein [Burkholderiaceae bacterium]
MKRWLIVACLLAVVLAIMHAQRPIKQPDGVLVDAEPLQTEPARQEPVRHGDFDLIPLADYDIQARVLSRHDYWFDDGKALAPTDFAVGWKRMSDSAVINRLDIEQSDRWYRYSWRDTPPIPAGEIVVSSANMHLIPGDRSVARALDRVRVGQVIRMRGQLVEARKLNSNWRRVSSLRRDDTGSGACELMLVESLDIIR